MQYVYVRKLPRSGTEYVSDILYSNSDVCLRHLLSSLPTFSNYLKQCLMHWTFPKTRATYAYPKHLRLLLSTVFHPLICFVMFYLLKSVAMIPKPVSTDKWFAIPQTYQYTHYCMFNYGVVYIHLLYMKWRPINAQCMYNYALEQEQYYTIVFYYNNSGHF